MVHSASVGADDSLSESEIDGENNGLIKALGMTKGSGPPSPSPLASGEEQMTEPLYDIVPNPKAENVDLSDLRGVGSSEKKKKAEMDMFNNSDTDLENLAELVPDVKARRRPTDEDESELENAAKVMLDGEEVEVVKSDGAPAAGPEHKFKQPKHRKFSMKSGVSTDARRMSAGSNHNDKLNRIDSMLVQDSCDVNLMGTKKDVGAPHGGFHSPHHHAIRPFPASIKEDSTDDDGYPDSERALEDEQVHDDAKVSNEFLNLGSSAQSVSTATQTHEVRMPMYLPTFKPATGCTNASDFIVRCFVARLRSGITVVKHGRSRWCKSRLRILHIHPDGRSLSWKPAEGEPTSSKRPPKLDLSTCMEVRHAWSPDPQNPMYTGTPILRQKCEAANAHKSYALIFKQRTVDITAVTADQCKVLMEGFSALCFRLQVANLAGREKKGQHARPMPEEDGVSTTASATLTNTSTPRVR